MIFALVFVALLKQPAIFRYAIVTGK